MAYSNPIPSLDEEIGSVVNEHESDYTPLNEVYFAFIDVLGFKKTFDDMKISKEKDTANKYRDVFNYYFALMNSAKLMDPDKKTGCYAGQTSDSLYFYTDREDYLLQFIKIFSHFSLYAMSQNVFFRGGIAKGALFKKEKYQFYGDSVIGAYLLESTISKNPIIVIDEQTHLDMLKVPGYSDFVDTKQERHYIKPFEFLDKDVIILDIEEGFAFKDVNREMIEKNILENRRIFEYDAKNYLKYVFLMEEFERTSTKKLK